MLAISITELLELPHSLNSYLVLRDYIVKNDNPNIYRKVIEEYSLEIPAFEIISILRKASKTFPESVLETLWTDLFFTVCTGGTSHAYESDSK